MKIAIHQPEHFPYLGYFKKMENADLFVILDDSQFSKGNWHNRNKFLKKIEKLGVETRPIISGNFLKQPSIKKYKLNKKSNFKNSDIVNNHGFFIGLPTSAISDKNIKKLVGVFEKSL